MKKILLFAFFVLTGFVSESQTIVKFWVQFTDKNNSPYSVSSPSQFLSQRAINRRTAQNIPVTITDLPVNPSYVSSVAATGAQVWCTSKWLNGVVIFTNDTNVINAVEALPFVSSVTGAGIRQGRPVNDLDKGDFTEPMISSKRSGTISTLTLDYGQALNQISMLGGLCLHNQGFQGQGLQIAVLDAGFNSVDTMMVFDSLFANNQILGTWDFVQRHASVYEDNTHGTMVLSCMGANAPGIMIGTAPKASYWLLRSEEAANEYIQEEYFWAAAAEFADSAGADVINSSLGYNRFDDASQDHVYATDMNGHTCPSSIAADYAVSRGMAVVVSAGNSGSNPWFYIGAPADADSILAVGAVDGSGVLAGFSSRGPASDGEVKPNIVAQGAGSTVAAVTGGVISGNGTSFASPIACGLVTCLWQAHPQFTGYQIMRSVEQSSSQFLNPDSLKGYGLPDFCAANLSLGGNPWNIGNGDQLFDLNPRPFTDDGFGFGFYSASKQDLVISLYDVRGRCVIQQTTSVEENSINRFVVNDVQAMRYGLYIMVVQTASNRFVERVVKGY